MLPNRQCRSNLRPPLLPLLSHPTMQQPGGLRERAIASLLSVASAASLGPAVRLAALRSLAGGQALPAALGGEAEEAVLWPLQLAAAASVAAAAAAAHTAAGTDAARAQEVAVNAVWSAACRVLGPEWASQYSRQALADAAAAPAGSGGAGSGSGAGRPLDTSVREHVVALHTRLQASKGAAIAVRCIVACMVRGCLVAGRRMLNPTLRDAPPPPAPAWPSAAAGAARPGGSGPAHLLRHPGAAVQCRQPFPVGAVTWRTADGRCARGETSGHPRAASPHRRLAPRRHYPSRPAPAAPSAHPARPAPLAQAPCWRQRSALQRRRLQWQRSPLPSSCWRTPLVFRRRCCAARQPTSRVSCCTASGGLSSGAATNKEVLRSQSAGHAAGSRGLAFAKYNTLAMSLALKECSLTLSA